jgi:hypothetical protein
MKAERNSDSAPPSSPIGFGFIALALPARDAIMIDIRRRQPHHPLSGE